MTPNDWISYILVYVQINSTVLKIVDAHGAEIPQKQTPGTFC